MSVERGVIGVGYEGQTIEQLTDGICRWGVSTLVDVRLNALSRKRGFSKNGLRDHLAQVGIGYLHMPELGNLRENREGYSKPDSEMGARARTVFTERMSSPAAEARLDEIVGLARTGMIAVLCYEKNERECHRHEVLDALRERLALLVDA